MKKIILFSAAFILLSVTLKSQDTLVYNQKHKEEKKDDEFKTLFGNHRSGGFYGSFNIGYSVIDNKDAVQMGGRFAWVANHSLAIGLGGTGFVNELHYGSSGNYNMFLTGGYGGLYIEPILLPNYPVHLSFPVLLGAGGISYILADHNYQNNYVEDVAAFVIAEPSAELEFNVTRFFRLAFGAGYRFPSPFDVGVQGSATANAESLKGWTYNVSFKFGKF
jgi:hypothetical protein